MHKSKIIIYGGNGFVGTHIAEQLVNLDCEVVCVSRTGKMPAQLKNIDWAQKVAWLTGDALQPDANLLTNTTAVVSLVGSLLLPTFSKQAYQQQLFINIQSNAALFDMVSKSSVQRLVVLGVHLPKLIQTEKFAYVKGKIMTEAALRDFVEISQDHSAVILKPTAIYGMRHTKNGKKINMAALMAPLAKLQSFMPSMIKRILPETLVSVDAVAHAVINACFDQAYADKFTCLSNQKIIELAQKS